MAQNGNVKGSINRVNLNTTSGVWNLDDVVLSRYDNTWPTTLITPVQMFLVAGGASGFGAQGAGAGGGAGAVLWSNTQTLSFGTTYTVTIGAGAPVQAQGSAANGANSSIVASEISMNVIALYGGTAAANGGSGGGTWFSTVQGSDQIDFPGWTEYGNPGGSGFGYSNEAQYGGHGGGGGAGGPGGNGVYVDAYVNNGGNGGIGIYSTISGSNTAYAGGGGAGDRPDKSGSIGYGGSGIGGDGSKGGTGGSGAVNTGSGGGGSHTLGGGSGAQGGGGGSGIFILSYSNSEPALANTTGSPTITYSGNNRIYKWTGSGSFRV